MFVVFKGQPTGRPPYGNPSVPQQENQNQEVVRYVRTKRNPGTQRPCFRGAPLFWAV